MARRLTTFSKLLITMIIVGALYLGFLFLKNGGYLGDMAGDTTNPTTTTTTTNSAKKEDSGKKGWFNNDKKDGDVITVGVVTWGGYAGGQYFNEGFDANTNSRFYKDYGFKVQFEILDDFVASRKAFENGQVDLLWATIDAFPTEVSTLAGDPQVVFQADWSRGGDAIVARRGINKVSDLKGKKIAVAELTPSHTFLLWLLKAGDLSTKDVELVKFASAIDAAQAFKSRQVDAAVVWSPDDEACVADVPGARVLENTKSASHIIADVFLAKKDFIKNNSERLGQLYEGWMRGASEINKSDVAKQKAAKILSENFEGFSQEMTLQAINNVRLCTHGDNLNFFGLNPNYKGVRGQDLYSKMTVDYTKLGYIEGSVPSWRLISSSETVRGASLSGADHAEEPQKTFTMVTEKEKVAPALATKELSISFPSGSFTLDENAKNVIDLGFVDIAKAFSNSRIRIEGNTDNVGSRANNLSLSNKRAQAVMNYLRTVHGMPQSRFIITGNGPDKPVAGCETNATEACKAKNRRTDFELVSSN